MDIPAHLHGDWQFFITSLMRRSCLRAGIKQSFLMMSISNALPLWALRKRVIVFLALKSNCLGRIPFRQIGPFTLTMTADYYAGGRVVGQEVSWQVMQFLHTFEAPDQYPGFLFSTDQRFSDGTPFRAAGSTKKEITDEKRFCNAGTEPSLGTGW